MFDIASIIENEPIWPVNLLIGALIPIILTGAYRLLSGIFSRFFSRSYLVLGKWYLANSSQMNGEPYVTREIWTIYRNLIGNTVVRVVNEQNPNIVYRGRFAVEGNHAIITYHASRHTESVTTRIYLPPTPNSRFLSGIWLSHDYDGVISSGVVTLSQDPFAKWDPAAIWAKKSAFKDHVLSVRP